MREVRAGCRHDAARAEAGDQSPTRRLARRIRAGLELLLQARRYADELACDAWDFAVEIAPLRAAGITNSDLRWMVCKEYVSHAQEVIQPGSNAREFCDVGALVFTKRSCFVLTDTGVKLAVGAAGPMDDFQSRGSGLSNAQCAAPDAILEGGGLSNPMQPCWDAVQKELRVGSETVKQFRLPSRNQEMILAAFEEEGWPWRIDDPLPPSSRIDPKRRLHDTIKSLNRNQKCVLLRFMGDGTGQGVRWRPVVSLRHDAVADGENGAL